jgi:Rrf2 family protein
MRVSQRLDYALQAMVLLAGQPPGEYVAAGDLADRLGLPRRFVEQQVTVLARAGVVECRRGASGGCRLSRPADQLTVFDVVTALDGDVIDVPRQQYSATAEMWADAGCRLEDALKAVPLSSLAVRQRALDAETAQMYYI